MYAEAKVVAEPLSKIKEKSDLSEFLENVGKEYHQNTVSHIFNRTFEYSNIGSKSRE